MTLTEIKKLSPVRITYETYISGDGEYRGTSKTIAVSRLLKHNNKMETLLHEIGHAVHDAIDCPCMQDLDDHTLAEYHAARFTMKYIKNNPALIRVFIGKINQIAAAFEFSHKFRILPGSKDLDIRIESEIGQLKPYLIISLPCRAVGNNARTFPGSNLNLTLG